MNPVAVGGQILEVRRPGAADGLDDRRGNGKTAQHAWSTRGELADRALIGRNGGRRRDVDATGEILGDGHPHQCGNRVGVEPTGDQPVAGGLRQRMKHHAPSGMPATASSPWISTEMVR